MRRLVTLVLALALLPVGVTAQATAASAASPVTIGKIATVTAKYHSKAKVKPRVKHASSTKVVSALLTVKRGARTVVRRATSARLAPGTYTVTTTVRYRVSHVQRTTTTVTERVVGAPAYLGTPVTCVASRVDASASPTSLDAVCTGPAFDGSVTLTNLLAWDDGVGEQWGIDDGGNMLTFAVVPAVGAPFAATLEPATDLLTTRHVTRTTTAVVWSGVRSTSRTQTLHVKQGRKPNHTAPDAYGECPSWAPIKGNADSGIYHVPGGRWYSVTVAEECFTTPAAARAHGYRASRNG